MIQTQNAPVRGEKVDQNVDPLGQKALLVAEIIGPAGVGKSTLARALRRADPHIRTNLPLRQPKHLLRFVGHTVLLLPTFLRQWQRSGAFTVAESKVMVHLAVLHAILQQQPLPPGSRLLLDQGPVFKLARFSEFGVAQRQRAVFAHWWEACVTKWSATLDLVIQLDAPDAILLERIQHRNSWHRVQHQSAQDAYAFLTRYRQSYEYTLAALCARHPLPVLRFDTSQEPVEQIVQKILGTLERSRAHE